MKRLPVVHPDNEPDSRSAAVGLRREHLPVDMVVVQAEHAQLARTVDESITVGADAVEDAVLRHMLGLAVDLAVSGVVPLLQPEHMALGERGGGPGASD
jgi:hypothetical protein